MNIPKVTVRVKNDELTKRYLKRLCDELKLQISRIETKFMPRLLAYSMDVYFKDIRDYAINRRNRSVDLVDQSHRQVYFTTRDTPQGVLNICKHTSCWLVSVHLGDLREEQQSIRAKYGYVLNWKNSRQTYMSDPSWKNFGAMCKELLAFNEEHRIYPFSSFGAYHNYSDDQIEQAKTILSELAVEGDSETMRKVLSNRGRYHVDYEASSRYMVYLADFLKAVPEVGLIQVTTHKMGVVNLSQRFDDYLRSYGRLNLFGRMGHYHSVQEALLDGTQPFAATRPDGSTSCYPTYVHPFYSATLEDFKKNYWQVMANHRFALDLPADPLWALRNETLPENASELAQEYEQRLWE